MPDPTLPAADPAAAARAAERFATTHAAEADLAYAVLETPVGTLLAAATERGLVRLAYEDDDGGEDAIVEHLARRVGPRVLRAPRRLDALARELEEYFAGRRSRFDVPLDLRLVGGPFGRQVLAACSRIPFGATSTYREIAHETGRPGASRATGNALGANPIPIVVPCHRVLRTGGGLGGYTGGLHRKERLLRLEGVLLA